MNNVADILTLVNAGGVVAILLVFLRLMVTGQIVSRSVVRAIVRETVERVMRELEDRRVFSQEDNGT